MTALTAFFCAAMLLGASLLGSFLGHHMRVYHTGLPEVTGMLAILFAMYGSLLLLGPVT